MKQKILTIPPTIVEEIGSKATKEDSRTGSEISLHECKTVEEILENLPISLFEENKIARWLRRLTIVMQVFLQC